MVQFNSFALLLVNWAITSATTIEDRLNAALEKKKRDVNVSHRPGIGFPTKPSGSRPSATDYDDMECAMFWDTAPDGYDPFLGTLARLGEVPCNDDDFICDMRDLPDFGSFPATCDAVSSDIETELASAGLVISCADRENEYINLPYCAASACTMGLSLEMAEPHISPFFPDCEINLYEMGGSDDDLYEDFGSTECGLDFYSLFEDNEEADFSLGLLRDEEKSFESCVFGDFRGFCYYDDHVDDYQAECLARGGSPLKLLAEFECRDKGEAKFHQVYRNTPVCMGNRCDEDKFIEYLLKDASGDCDDGDFRIEPDVGQDVGIGDTFGLGSFECAHDFFMALVGWPFMNAFEKEPKFFTDSHATVLDWSQYADEFQSMCNDSGRIVHNTDMQVLDDSDKTFYAGLPMCITSECEATKVAKKVSRLYFDTYKTQKSTPVPCEDDPKNYFYQRGFFRTCGWLSSKSTMHKRKICRKPQLASLPAAKDICTTTCEFTREFDQKTSTKTCRWLETRKDGWKTWICNNNQSARDMCPVTCGWCDDSNDV